MIRKLPISSTGEAECKRLTLDELTAAFEKVGSFVGDLLAAIVQFLAALHQFFSAGFHRVAAVEGAGQHELLRLFASRERPRSGKVTTPENVAFIPADRHREALILDFDPAENLALRGAGERSGMLRWKELASRASTLIDRFDVRGARPGKPMQTLSGGNQQKFVLARELSDRPTLVVADNPTRGLDIRATRDVHARLRLAASQGAGVIVYSSDLDEVLALATRVVVVHAGRVHDVPRDRAVVGRAMLGVA